MTQSHDTTLDRLFGVVTGEDDLDRACKAIPDQACTDVPRNYFLNIGNGAATKLAEQIAGPNLVLPWLLALLGSPVFLVGLLMPVKQAGSLLPQLVVAGQIRRFSRRKGIWVAAGLIQAGCLVLMIPAALGLPGAIGGGRNAIQEAGAGLGYLRTQAGYRQYLLVRALLLSVELAIPFYVLHAQTVLAGGAGSLGLFVIAVGIANTISSPFWGRFADLASHQVMKVSGLLGALTAVLALAMEWLPPLVQNAYVYSLVLCGLGILAMLASFRLPPADAMVS